MKGLSEKPKEPHGGDPASRFPSGMLRVAIPEGAILDVKEIRNNEAYKEFGVTQMMYGMVSHGLGDYTEGTVIYFDGDTFRVDVGRRDLNADDVNRIAKLSMDLDVIANILESLPKQIENAEQLIKDLNKSKDIFRDRTANMKFDATEVVSELGILISKMKPSLEEQREQLRETISELASLGVTQIHDQNGGPMAGVPVEDMARKFAAEAQQAEKGAE